MYGMENESDQTNPIAILSKVDPGDEVQRRFRYQHTVTAQLALLMYLHQVPYKEIYCELHEDILCQYVDNQFCGIQVKTKEPHLGLIRINDEIMISSLSKFSQMDFNFYGKFKKFVFISNCEYDRGETGYSINTLKSQLKRDDIYSGTFVPKTLEDVICSIESQSKSSRRQVIDVLKKTEFQKMPDMDEVHSKIIIDTLSQIPKCADYPVERLRRVLESLIFMIYKKSSRMPTNPIQDYITLLDGNVLAIKTAEEINIKRLSVEDVESVLSGLEALPYLGFLTEEIDQNPKRGEIMVAKMNCGLISQPSIENMDKLRDDCEQYFLRSFYKNQENRRKYSHVKTVVRNQAVEAAEKVERNDAPYGKEMMREIEDRLIKLTETTDDRIMGIKYETLKGLVGSLAGECKIQFSATPEGGWLSDE